MEGRLTCALIQQQCLPISLNNEMTFSQLTPSSQPDSKASYTVFYLIYWADSDHGASPQLNSTLHYHPIYPVVSPDCSRSWTAGVFNTWNCSQQPSIWWLQETHHKVILEMATWLGLIWNFQKQLLQSERCLRVWFFFFSWSFAWFLGRQIAF